MKPSSSILSWCTLQAPPWDTLCWMVLSQHSAGLPCPYVSPCPTRQPGFLLSIVSLPVLPLVPVWELSHCPPHFCLITCITSLLPRLACCHLGQKFLKGRQWSWDTMEAWTRPPYMAGYIRHRRERHSHGHAVHHDLYVYCTNFLTAKCLGKRCLLTLLTGPWPRAWDCRGHGDLAASCTGQHWRR